VNKVEVQLEAKGYAIGRFLDTERAFHSTSTEAIKQTMIRHETLVDWVQDMLAERILAVTLWDTTIEGNPVKSCPLRGVLSPLLWCLGKRPIRGFTKERFSSLWLCG
jgi:hypothetical protein